MMIYTLTLNPAIDRTIFIDEINYEDVTRIKQTVRDAAGKGINVARVIDSLDLNVVCLGYIGGKNGEFIKHELDKQHIVHQFVEILGETRENIKVCQTIDPLTLEFNEAGPNITKIEQKKLFDILSNLLKPGDKLSISGSIPKGLKQDIYKDIINFCNEHEVLTILDASGDLFTTSLEATPTIIKPNRYELEQYMEKQLPDDLSLVNASRSLLEKGVKQVIVSLGKDGSIYVDKDTVYRTKGVFVKPKSTVGAGDSFVGGYCAGLEQNLDTKSCLILASAVAMASVKTSGTAPGKIEDVNQFKKQIDVQTLTI
jgi:1-phosphofructokinase